MKIDIFLLMLLEEDVSFHPAIDNLFRELGPFVQLAHIQYHLVLSAHYVSRIQYMNKMSIPTNHKILPSW